MSMMTPNEKVDSIRNQPRVVLFCAREGWKLSGWSRKQWWACGLALWLGFTCLLRPAEVLKLRVGDLSFSTGQGGESLDPGMVVVVRTPKTRRIWHRQFVLCVENGRCVGGFVV